MYTEKEIERERKAESLSVLDRAEADEKISPFRFSAPGVTRDQSCSIID